MPRGRQQLFTSENIQKIRDNDEQLTYSEWAQRFHCSIQTIRRVIQGKGVYKTDGLA